MERYTRLLLHFAYGLSRGFGQSVETFVFSTRLTRITHQLQTKDVDQALAQVAQRGAGLVGRHAHRRGAEGASISAGAGGCWGTARWCC